MAQQGVADASLPVASVGRAARLSTKPTKPAASPRPQKGPAPPRAVEELTVDDFDPQERDEMERSGAVLTLRRAP
jgi:hypothetical protein